METTPKFLQGVFAFEGAGLMSPMLLSETLIYSVPANRRSQLVYMRAGNSSAELITLILMLDGKPMRYYPLGAKSGSHVPLAVVEDLQPDSKLEVYIAAPTGISGSVVLDIGMIEI